MRTEEIKEGGGKETQKEYTGAPGKGQEDATILRARGKFREVLPAPDWEKGVSLRKSLGSPGGV